MAKIRILLIEDNRILREGITDLLERRGGFAVAVSDGREALLIKVRAGKPSLALLDLGHGPGFPGAPGAQPSLIRPGPFPSRPFPRSRFIFPVL